MKVPSYWLTTRTNRVCSYCIYKNKINNKNMLNKEFRNIFLVTLISSVVLSGAVGFLAGSMSGKDLSFGQLKQEVVGDSSTTNKNQDLNNQSLVVSAVKKVSPAVVSIIITKDVPKMEQYFTSPSPNNDFFNQFFGNNDFFNFSTPQYRQNGTEKKEVGGGTGFIISKDGYVVTYNHVVSDDTAEYTVFMNDEHTYEAKIVARDP